MGGGGWEGRGSGGTFAEGSSRGGASFGGRFAGMLDGGGVSPTGVVVGGNCGRVAEGASGMP